MGVHSHVQGFTLHGAAGVLDVPQTDALNVYRRAEGQNVRVCCHGHAYLYRCAAGGDAVPGAADMFVLLRAVGGAVELPEVYCAEPSGAGLRCFQVVLEICDLSFCLLRLGLPVEGVLLPVGGPTLVDTDLICKEFNVSREWLLNGTGEMFLPESSGTVDALAAQYDLTPLERDMVENYCKLSKAQRQAFWDVMQKIIGSSAQSGSAEASPPGSGVAAAEAAYEKNFGTASGTPDAEATSMHEDTG